MPHASDRLVEEHKVIEKMLDILDRSVERLQAGEDLPAGIFLKAVDFIRNFADRCHHAKEEDILFKMMGERGLPQHSGPVGVMLSEHHYARQYTRNMESSAKRLEEGDQSAKSELIDNVRRYTQLLAEHINKENNVLYPMGNRLFSKADQQFLEQEFERIEKENIGEGVHEKYHHLVHELDSMLKKP